jgi:hypothetical protein
LHPHMTGTIVVEAATGDAATGTGASSGKVESGFASENATAEKSFRPAP